jgi:hypothetical protein
LEKDAVRFGVGVDSGIIQLARNPDHLERGGELYGKVQDLALWSAAGVWDSKKGIGAIGTPHGDGPHIVSFIEPSQAELLEMLKQMRKADQPYHYLINLDRYSPPPKPFTLYCGDVGRVDGAINFPVATTVGFFWHDDNTLAFFTQE